MRHLHYLVVILCLYISNGFAHDANKAFFRIEQKANSVEVYAEFPWSIRYAVLEQFPELEKSKIQNEFDTAFFEYIKANFILKSRPSILKLIKVKELKTEGHAHQNDFLFVFTGNNFDTVTNTIMFNVYEKQENYHEFETDNIPYDFITSKKKPSFRLEVTSKEYLGKDLFIIAMIVIFSITMTLIYIKMKKGNIA